MSRRQRPGRLNFSAALFRSIAVGLCQHLGLAAFEGLRRAVDALDFAAALAALERACLDARQGEALSL